MSNQFDKILADFGEASYQKTRSSGYAAGYYKSLAEEMFRNLNKKQQTDFMRQVERDTASLKTATRT